MTGTDELRGFQRKYLRGLAHSLKPAVQIGRLGITADVLREVERALDDHELIKVAMHKPKSKKAMAAELAGGTGAQLAGLVGHTAILYREHAEKPSIVLPRRSELEVDESAP